ncbi:rhomboid family intramembrane serine protease [Spirochaetia bacterium 38H-sp]|uniref:Rhomboid family intramembrane serine protease n=1 Tax=Rarispira pelagica TaxID=3141764 RepID=A0ABU9U8W5_9SPIR
MNLRFLRRPFKYEFFNATLYIIGFNLMFYFIGNIVPVSKFYLSLIPGAVLKGYVWQFFTYMFEHANFNHIFFNMLGVLLFGYQVERAMGSREFLLFYLLTGFLSGLLSFFYFIALGYYGVILLGASGALFGVMLAFATFFPRSQILVFFILPVPAPVLVLLYTALELFYAFSGTGGNVAHYTHVAGFLVAYLYLLIRHGINPIKVFRDEYFH